nr:zinc finger, CCHC-type [Tanacetum cinerariifolium]
MASMNTRLNIEKLDGNIVQKHGGNSRDREAEVFQVSNDDTAVAQRRLEDKQPEEKTNMNCLVNEQKKVHLSIKVGANITITEVPGQEGAEGNVAKNKKVEESMKANLKKLLKATIGPMVVWMVFPRLDPGSTVLVDPGKPCTERKPVKGEVF